MIWILFALVMVSEAFVLTWAWRENGLLFVSECLFAFFLLCTFGGLIGGGTLTLLYLYRWFFNVAVAS